MKRRMGQFVDWTEARRWTILALALWVGLMLAAFSGCALNRLNDALMAPTKWVHGLITRVERRPDYEAICGIRARLYQACDDVPVCCAYQIEVRDSVQSTWFFAFWPRYARGLERGRYLVARLLRDAVWQFGKCNAYTCPQDIAYVLESDDDWRYVDP